MQAECYPCGDSCIGKNWSQAHYFYKREVKGLSKPQRKGHPIHLQGEIRMASHCFLAGVNAFLVQDQVAHNLIGLYIIAGSHREEQIGDQADA